MAETNQDFKEMTKRIKDDKERCKNEFKNKWEGVGEENTKNDKWIEKKGYVTWFLEPML